MLCCNEMWNKPLFHYSRNVQTIFHASFLPLIFSPLFWDETKRSTLKHVSVFLLVIFENQFIVVGLWIRVCWEENYKMIFSSRNNTNNSDQLKTKIGKLCFIEGLFDGIDLTGVKGNLEQFRKAGGIYMTKSNL